MADVVLTADERRRIQEVLLEIEPVVDEFFGDARPLLSEDEWRLMRDYAHACVKGALQVGICLRAVAETHGCRAIEYPGRGSDTFVADCLRAWRDSFAPIRDPWRLALISEKLNGGEKRLMADVATLEAMAADRLYASFDEECARLLADS